MRRLRVEGGGAVNVYDNDPRVVRDAEYLPGSFEVDRYWRIIRSDGHWHAYLLDEWGGCVGDPIGPEAVTADEKISELIGDPR